MTWIVQGKHWSINIIFFIATPNINNKAANEKDATTTGKAEEVKEEVLKSAEKGKKELSLFSYLTLTFI